MTTASATLLLSIYMSMFVHLKMYYYLFCKLALVFLIKRGCFDLIVMLIHCCCCCYYYYYYCYYDYTFISDSTCCDVYCQENIQVYLH